MLLRGARIISDNSFCCTFCKKPANHVMEGKGWRLPGGAESLIPAPVAGQSVDGIDDVLQRGDGSRMRRGWIPGSGWEAKHRSNQQWSSRKADFSRGAVYYSRDAYIGVAAPTPSHAGPHILSGVPSN